MQFDLVPHPSTPPADPLFKVWVTVDHAGAGRGRDDQHLVRVGAPADRFVIPKLSEPWRADELWQTTCFEAFLRAADGDGYREWNFAPSGNWAAYDFTG